MALRAHLQPAGALLAFAMVWLCLPVAAQPAVPAPAASAASAPAASPPMSVVGEWRGPFQGTKVVKLLDAEDGVACYFYMPVSVPSNRVCDAQGACSFQYPAGVGTVSCVKVREGRREAVPAPAKPARGR